MMWVARKMPLMEYNIFHHQWNYPIAQPLVGSRATVKHGKNIVTQKPNKNVENIELHQRKISSPDILDPSNPVLDVTPQAHVIPEESVNSEIPANIRYSSSLNAAFIMPLMERIALG